MHILITGHTGFKGSWLSATLIYLGANVVGLSIDIPTKPSIFELLKLKRKIKTYFFDINNIKKIIKRLKFLIYVGEYLKYKSNNTSKIKLFIAFYDI